MSRRRSHPIEVPPEKAPEWTRTDHSRLDDVAGHRVMRRFAVGTRATLLLAHRSSRSERESARPRLLKVFHPATPVSSVDVELTALSSGVTPHVVRLIDVATIESGQPPCLVLEKLPGPTLSSYLDQQTSMSAGQAVTILAPLCATVQALHDAGVTHGGVHLRRIVFDASGAPVLTGFGRGILRSSPDSFRAASAPRRLHAGGLTSSGEPEWRAAVLDDQRDLLAVVDEVLLSIAGAHASRASLDTEALAREIGSGPSREFLSRLESLLFTLATPEVVAVVASGMATGTHMRVRESGATKSFERKPPTTSTTDFDWALPHQAPQSIPTENRLVAALRVLGASSSALETVSSVADAAARLTARRRTVRESSAADSDHSGTKTPQRDRRRPVLVGVSCAAVAVTALLFVLPSSGDEARAGAGDTASTTPAEGVAVNGEPSPTAVVDDSPSLQGDDPAEALRVLARTNTGCEAATDVEICLATVFQPEYLESQLIDDAPTVIDATDAVVTGSWGGSALVAARINDQPASFLLMKGETGWRVRDVFVSNQ